MTINDKRNCRSRSRKTQKRFVREDLRLKWLRRDSANDCTEWKTSIR